MKSEWLWDSRFTERQAARILKDPTNPHFPSIAEKLLGRISPSKKAFLFLDKESFCRHWPRIKKRLKQDAWMRDKVTFWQMVYESLHKELKAQGIKLREPVFTKPNEVQRAIAEQIKKLRGQKNYTQNQLAHKLGVIQPYVSRIEKGRENYSIQTLRGIAKALDKKLVVKFS